MHAQDTSPLVSGQVRCPLRQDHSAAPIWQLNGQRQTVLSTRFRARTIVGRS